MDVETLRATYAALRPVLTERSRGYWAATEARALGHGGIAAVIRATGISRSTIQRGLRELDATGVAPPTRIRRADGGRKSLTTIDPTLVPDLALVEPTAPGDPSPRCVGVARVRGRWRSRCRRWGITSVTPGLPRYSATWTISLQGYVKTTEGRQHPDRDAQFREIAATVARAHRQQQPAISVDTKRRNSSAPSRIRGRRGDPRAIPSRYASTIVWSRRRAVAKPFPLASTISSATKGG